MYKSLGDVDETRKYMNLYEFQGTFHKSTYYNGRSTSSIGRWSYRYEQILDFQCNRQAVPSPTLLSYQLSFGIHPLLILFLTFRYRWIKLDKRPFERKLGGVWHIEKEARFSTNTGSSRGS